MSGAHYDHEKAVPVDGGATLSDHHHKAHVFERETAHEAAERGHYATDQ